MNIVNGMVTKKKTTLKSAECFVKVCYIQFVIVYDLYVCISSTTKRRCETAVPLKNSKLKLYKIYI
jgi:hypothetical protein